LLYTPLTDEDVFHFAFGTFKHWIEESGCLMQGFFKIFVIESEPNQVVSATKKFNDFFNMKE